MHFADCHFGVELYGRLDPATGLNTRLIDFRNSLNAIIDAAIEAGVHAALFTGDAYKSRDPSQTHQREFALCIRRLTDRGIPVALLTGNHDLPGVKGRAHTLEIFKTLGVGGVYVFSQPDVQKIETPGGTIQIAALPTLMPSMLAAREFTSAGEEEKVGNGAKTEAFPLRRRLESQYVDYLKRLREKVDRAYPTVLLGHFWVDKAMLSDWQAGYFSSNEPTVSLSEIAVPEFDYVALGHIHHFQNLNPNGKPPVIYAGSPDIIDFGERNDDKGFVLVDIECGHVEFRHINNPLVRQFKEIVVDATGDDPMTTILAAIEKEDVSDAIVRLTYLVDQERQSMLRDREIREALKDAHTIAGIQRQVRSKSSRRSEGMTEARSTIESLKAYIATMERLKPLEKELVELAMPLIGQVEREADNVMS